MNTTKRDLLFGGAAIAAASIGLAPSAFAEANYAPGDGQWRRFDVTTRLRPPVSDQPIQAWAPLASVEDDLWVRPVSEHFSAPGAHKRVHTVNGARMLHVSWAPNAQGANLEVTTRFQVRDRAMPAAGSGRSLSAHDRAQNLAGTRYVPVDGLVRETVTPIVAGADTDVAKTRAIYEWMIANTYRDGATRGCGTGDVNALLNKGAGHMGGKCADLNALFVALSRSAGVPARESYGVRVSASRFGYRSLGPSTPVVTRSQHCRAEAYLEGLGWVAMDPADVRKVMLEEVQGGLPLDDERVVAVHRALFGATEGNWLPYNRARDIALPGSSNEPLPFFMYTQYEIGGVRGDCLNPDTMNCVIEAHEV